MVWRQNLENCGCMKEIETLDFFTYPPSFVLDNRMRDYFIGKFEKLFSFLLNFTGLPQGAISRGKIHPFIFLIPKAPNAHFSSKFRPINLCNVKLYAYCKRFDYKNWTLGSQIDFPHLLSYVSNRWIAEKDYYLSRAITQFSLFIYLRYSAITQFQAQKK